VPNFGLPDGETWTLLARMAELFEPTLDAIRQLEGQTYVTLPLVLLQFCHMERSIVALMLKCMYFVFESCLTFFYGNSFLLLDPQPENEQFHVIAADLKEVLNQLWDNLPLDTVSATMLDPRFKFYEKIPKNERNESLDRLKAVCYFSFFSNSVTLWTLDLTH
jgi:hypothetical protein